MRAKVQEKKLKFKEKFERKHAGSTAAYNATNVDKILEELHLD